MKRIHNPGSEGWSYSQQFVGKKGGKRKNERPALLRSLRDRVMNTPLINVLTAPVE